MNRKPLSETEALNRMAAYCSMAEHCSSEVEQKLRQLGQSDETIQRILLCLHQKHFIDEERYARAFVNDRFRFYGWGKVKILQALRLKQIPANICQSALQTIDEEDYHTTLLKLLQSKRLTIKAPSAYQSQVKLLRFALSRGFGLDDARLCLSRMSMDDFSD